jgi:hypothetical protein
MYSSTALKAFQDFQNKMIRQLDEQLRIARSKNQDKYTLLPKAIAQGKAGSTSIGKISQESIHDRNSS